MGRPTDYTPEIAAEICERLSAGQTLLHIVEDDAMPSRASVYRWLDVDKEFRDSYARARERGAHTLAEETLRIADDSTRDRIAGEIVDHDHIARSRLRVDTRKWYAGQIAPKTFGPSMRSEVSGPDGGPIRIIDERARAARILAILAAAALARDTGADLV